MAPPSAQMGFKSFHRSLSKGNDTELDRKRKGKKDRQTSGQIKKFRQSGKQTNKRTDGWTD